MRKRTLRILLTAAVLTCSVCGQAAMAASTVEAGSTRNNDEDALSGPGAAGTATVTDEVVEAETEAAAESTGMLGIGLSSFWPFTQPENNTETTPYGLDEFSFVIIREGVQAGTGNLEIRKAENDELLAVIPVESIRYTPSIEQYEDGSEEATTELYCQLDTPIEYVGDLYLNVPEGAFEADGQKSSAIQGKDQLVMTIADYGFAPGEYKTLLTTGETTEYGLILGSADHAEIWVDGTAVSINQEVLSEDGTIVVTGVEPGEVTVYVEFQDAAGNPLTTGQTMFVCK